AVPIRICHLDVHAAWCQGGPRGAGKLLSIWGRCHSRARNRSQSDSGGVRIVSAVQGDELRVAHAAAIGSDLKNRKPRSVVLTAVHPVDRFGAALSID